MTDKIWICDVDGVVAQFVEPILKQVGSKIIVKDVKNWDLFELMTTEEKTTAFKILDLPEFWASQPLVAGAQEGIQKIRNADFEVLWCTSPWFSCREWGYARREWIKKYFDSPMEQIITSARKDIIRGHVFVDDKASHIDDWTAIAGNEDHHGFVFDTPYNQDSKHPRVMGWGDIDRVIEEVLRGK